jgi:hypothetical protein
VKQENSRWTRLLETANPLNQLMLSASKKPQESFTRIFQRLLPSSAKLSLVVSVLFGVVLLIEAGSINIFGINVRGFWAALLCLSLFPMLTVATAFVGALHVYFGPSIPGLRVFYPCGMNQNDNDTGGNGIQKK